jgi:hypothetical protein
MDDAHGGAAREPEGGGRHPDAAGDVAEVPHCQNLVECWQHVKET